MQRLIPLPEQTLVASTLDTGVPLSPEALGGQLQLQGDGLQVLVVTAHGQKLIAQSGEDLQEAGERLLLHSISGMQKREDRKQAPKNLATPEYLPETSMVNHEDGSTFSAKGAQPCNQQHAGFSFEEGPLTDPLVLGHLNAIFTESVCYCCRTALLLGDPGSPSNEDLEQADGFLAISMPLPQRGASPSATAAASTAAASVAVSLALTTFSSVSNRSSSAGAVASSRGGKSSSTGGIPVSAGLCGLSSSMGAMPSAGISSSSSISSSRGGIICSSLPPGNTVSV
ncbi:hypothetical protein EYF80_017897 [Liparis tanakae]|uniref:Uncharacterized protein n=1 Tax=Liparis tanakae TaxID=230148 RepID=A0A4Z2I225_9TELE|nr:hypothetical protein EYF80_017897 [Liparis tanakae]